MQSRKQCALQVIDIMALETSSSSSPQWLCCGNIPAIELPPSVVNATRKPKHRKRFSNSQTKKCEDF